MEEVKKIGMMVDSANYNTSDIINRLEKDISNLQISADGISPMLCPILKVDNELLKKRFNKTITEDEEHIMSLIYHFFKAYSKMDNNPEFTRFQQTLVLLLEKIIGR